MKRISWGKSIDNMIKENIQLYGFNTGIRKSVFSLNKMVHNNYRRRKKTKENPLHPFFPMYPPIPIDFKRDFKLLKGPYCNFKLTATQSGESNVE